MPRPRTSEAKARLTGADKVNPERFRERREPKASGKPVGSPPAHLNATAKAVWKEMASSLGWLQDEDRHALECAATAIGQMRTMVKNGDPVTAAILAAVNTSIGKLGASPTDRSKVFSPEEPPEEDDPFSAFDTPVN